MKRANSILAATFGWDVSEVNECVYQRFTSPKVYSIGERYFAVSATKPKHVVGGEWRKHTDQFFSSGDRSIWVCDATLNTEDCDEN